MPVKKKCLKNNLYLVQHKTLAFNLNDDKLHVGPDEWLAAFKTVNVPLG